MPVARQQDKGNRVDFLNRKEVRIGDIRSLIHFGILIAFAIGASLFILKKAGAAISEVNALNDTPFFKMRREELDSRE